MIPQLLFFVAFACLSAYIGVRMFRITSYAKAIESYEKNPAGADWFVKYFLGYAFGMQRSMQKSMIHGIGDGLVSGFYRLAGIFFILVGVAAVVGGFALFSVMQSA